jgi:CcmD family protein
MRFLGSLFAAYSVLWIALFLYLLHLTRRSRRVEEEVEALRRMMPGGGPDAR